MVRGGLRAYFGTSTDKKPTAGVPNGSSFYEMDSGLLFRFDEQRREWLWQPDHCGGSGSGGVTDHRALTGRDAAEQHPIDAITGLSEALAAKAGSDAVGEAVSQSIHELTQQDVLNIWNST